MKTKLLFFYILCFIGFNLQTSSQTNDTLSNGKVIYSSNGQFFDITNHDTLHICPKSLMVMYKQNLDINEINEFESANGLTHRYEVGVDSVIYSLVNPNQ